MIFSILRTLLCTLSMYFSRDLFIKKGPISTLWLAGSVLRKLGRGSVMREDIVILCQSLLHPPVPLALRAVSTLMLGVTRIYERKVHFTLAEASEVASAMKEDKKRSHVNLNVTAARPEQINVPESFFDDNLMEEIDMHLLMSVEAARDETEIFEQFMPVVGMPGEFKRPVQRRSRSVTSFDAGLLEYDMVGIDLPEVEMPNVQSGAYFDLPDMDVSNVAEELVLEETPKRQRKKPVKRKIAVVIEEENILKDEDMRARLSDKYFCTTERPMRRYPLTNFPLNLQLPRVERLYPNKKRLTRPSSLPIYRLHPNFVSFYQAQCVVKVEALVPHPRGTYQSPSRSYSLNVQSGAYYDLPDMDVPISIEPELIARYASPALLDVEKGRKSVESRDSFLGRRISELSIPVSARRAPSILSLPEATLPEMTAPKDELPTARAGVSSGTRIFRDVLSEKFQGKGVRASIAFSHVIRDPLSGLTSRRDAAFGFFQLLVLKTMDAIDVKQDEPFAELFIMKGPAWNKDLLAATQHMSLFNEDEE